MNVIENSFLPFEAQQILAIPLCTSAQHDLIYWSPEKNGIYSVKSGHKMLCEKARRDEASSSTGSGGSGLWKGIWKLKVPGKLKHFLWKACTDSLPTKTNLLKRKIIAEPTCHLYGRCSEDVKHALWECEAVKIVWDREFSWVNRFEAANGSFLDLMERIIKKSGVAELFVTTAWFI